MFFSSFQYEHSTTYSKTQPNKGRPPKITIEILYDYMESVEKKRDERDAKIQIELEKLEKKSEEREVKLKIEL